jgi:hypothetical protein
MLKGMNKLKVCTLFILLAYFFCCGLYQYSALSENITKKSIRQFQINPNQPFSPGNIIASCITEETGALPYKRHSLIYIGFDSDTVKVLRESTVVKWEAWKWVDVPWFSSATENLSCKVSSSSECIFTLVESISVKIEVIDGDGHIKATENREYISGGRNRN